MAKIIKENFERTSYEESWTETVTAGNTLDENSTIPGTPPIGAGSQCLKAIFTAGATNCYALQTKTNQNISYVRGYVYLSQEGLNDTQVIANLRLANSEGSLVCDVIFRQTSGVLKLAFRYYSGSTIVTTAEVSASLNTWYRIEYKYDITNMLWEWRIDGITQASGSLTASTRTPDRAQIGLSHNGSAQSTLYTDLVVWDDTTWVGVGRRLRGMGVTREEQ